MWFGGELGAFKPIFLPFYAHSERPPAILAQLADVFKFPSLAHSNKDQRPQPILSLLLSTLIVGPYTYFVQYVLLLICISQRPCFQVIGIDEWIQKGHVTWRLNDES